jgi:manganese efflux pump family protein
VRPNVRYRRRGSSGRGICRNPSFRWRLLVSGAALSLDDLAVGLALGTVRYPIVLAVALFGLMSFVMSIIGLKLGGKLGAAAGEHGEVVGAIVLIGIAGAMAMGWLLPPSVD